MADQHKHHEGVRLDKWLWAARFYKTRTLAKEAIEGGKVRYNEARTKPGKIVEIGAEITLRQGWDDKIVTVVAVSDQRRGAPEAQQLYHESEENRIKREQLSWERRQHQMANMPPARRPNKKDRRHIHRFLDQVESGH